MSKKDFDLYYEEVCKQYKDFLEELKDFEELAKQQVVSPETIENAKAVIEPLKVNWETLNYVMYLLNKPVKKSKQDRYEKSCKPKQCKTDKEVYAENQKCIDSMKEFTEETRNG